MVWYHQYSSNLVRYVSKLLADNFGGLWIGWELSVRINFHMPAVLLRWPSKTIWTCFHTLSCVDVNLEMHPSSQIWPMEISAPDFRRGEMCTFFTPCS